MFAYLVVSSSTLLGSTTTINVLCEESEERERELENVRKS